MRHFSFTLQLPEGRIVQVERVAERLSPAFSSACRSVEARLGLPPWSGIVCVAYSSSAAIPIQPPVTDRVPAPLTIAA